MGLVNEHVIWGDVEMNMPYILESNPHPNLIRTSFFPIS